MTTHVEMPRLRAWRGLRPTNELWAMTRAAVGVGGTVGLLLLALHGCGIEPTQLALGWFGGVVWCAKHWESWAVFASIWAVIVSAHAFTLRQALTLLCKLAVSAPVAVGAVRGTWAADSAFGFLSSILIGLVLAVVTLAACTCDDPYGP